MNIRPPPSFAHNALSAPTLRPALAGLALFVAGASGFGIAFAQASPTGLNAQTLAQVTALATQAALALAPAGARIRVTPGALDSRLSLAPCAQVQTFQPTGVSPWGRSRIGLRCVQGAVPWQVYLPVHVEVWAPALVAQQALPAGARLEASQFSVAEVDWAAASAPPFSAADALAERLLARPLSAGQAPRASDLRSRQWFAQGESVQIVIKGAGFAVGSQGLAENAGLEGQTVRVRTESGRLVMGQAVGPRRVEIQL